MTVSRTSKRHGSSRSVDYTVPLVCTVFFVSFACALPPVMCSFVLLVSDGVSSTIFSVLLSFALLGLSRKRLRRSLWRSSCSFSLIARPPPARERTEQRYAIQKVQACWWRAEAQKTSGVLR